MIYVKGDIWSLKNEYENSWVVVTTNTTIKKNGEAVMGAGIAKEAKLRYPSLPRLLGEHIRNLGRLLYVYHPIICLPTKSDWRKKSRLDYIEKGCKELNFISTLLYSVGCELNVLMPKFGCGLGGLNWEREVRPLMDSILVGDNMILVNNE